ILIWNKYTRRERGSLQSSRQLSRLRVFVTGLLERGDKSAVDRRSLWRSWILQRQHNGLCSHAVRYLGCEVRAYLCHTIEETIGCVYIQLVALERAVGDRYAWTEVIAARIRERFIKPFSIIAASDLRS